MKAELVLAVMLLAAGARGEEINLTRNPAFDSAEGYELQGSAVYRKALGNPEIDAAGPGVALGDGAAGSVAQTVLIDPRQGRALSFCFRGLPQERFNAEVEMKVEFFGGRTAYDGKVKPLSPIVQQARRDLAANGVGRVNGAAVWRDYTLNFYVPFPQVDRVRLSVASKGGSAAGRVFFVSNFRLVRLPEPADPRVVDAPVRPAGQLLPLGGRWFYVAKTGETRPPAVFDHTNAERLLYRDGPDGQGETPFAGNMSATLHAGNEDLAGNKVTADRLVADNVTVRFDATSMILHTHGLPNHPTGRFPEEGYGNPNAIREQDETYYFPLNPKPDPNHVAYAPGGVGNALNMGPIGVAVNGVVFFNPFDANRIDATDMMDRCCGHPNQDGQYHYHKYPICLNSPWADEGKAHSPLIGWAFDGFPIYGPYEASNVMAKDVAGPTALNAFNLHYDAQRGWHYHVTPGKFPYVLGGYWGVADHRDVRPPRGRGPGGGGGPPGPPPG